MKNLSAAQNVVRFPVRFPVRSPRRLLSYEQLEPKELHSSQLSYGSSLTNHRRFEPKIAELLKIKLGLGAKFALVGGATKFFKKNFSVREGEKLVKAFWCCLSTTAGPIPGFIFISTDKIAFCSERMIKISSSGAGEPVCIHYKVVIPLTRINKARESKDNWASKKYLQIVTKDNFDFWFMGFLNHHKTMEYLQRAISQAHH